MRPPQAPSIDKRRTKQFVAELEERARAWIPDWGLVDDEGDFGRALLAIAGRFNSEVAERLDQAGEKMRRGFLDWLAFRGKAARPARMPVVFKLADTARQAVRAAAPVRLQADANGVPVVFETEQDVRVVPGVVDLVVGVDADKDAFFLPPGGLSDLKPLESLPSEWRAKSFAATGASKLQLDPEVGLIEGMLVEINGTQYSIVTVDGDLVTIDRPLEGDVDGGGPITKVTTFTPFGGSAHDAQKHALYLGDSELLNLDAAATIEVVGASTLSAGYTWEFLGKGVDGDDEEKWRPLNIDSEKQKTVTDAVVLSKPKGEISEKPVNGIKARWVRASRDTLEPTDEPFTKDEIRLRINPSGCQTAPCAPPAGTESPVAEAMANTTPLVLGKEFAPLGREPRQFDTFYLGSKEAFSKTGAKVQLCFEMADASFAVLSTLRGGANSDRILAGVAADKRLHLLSFDNTTGRLTHYPGREPLRPPSPGILGASNTNPPVDLDPLTSFRIPLWNSTGGFSVAVTANGVVWAWTESTAIPTQSGWRLLGSVGAGVVSSDSPIQALVHLGDGAEGALFALRESKLFVRDLNDNDGVWELVETNDTNADPVSLQNIAPIYIEGATTIDAGTVAEGLVGVADDNKLYGIRPVIASLSAECTELLDGITPEITPAAVRRRAPSLRLEAVAIGDDPDDRKVFAFESESGSLDRNDEEDADVEWPTIVGSSIDVNLTDGLLTFVFCAKKNAEAVGLHAWNPFEAANPLLRTKISPEVGIANGAPTLLPGHVTVPISSIEVIVATFKPNNRKTISEELRTAIVATKPEDLMDGTDSVAIPKKGGGYQLATVPLKVEHRGQTLYEFDIKSVDDPFYVYRSSAPSHGADIDENDPSIITLRQPAPPVGTGSILLITTDTGGPQLYEIEGFDTGSLEAQLDRDLELDDPDLPEVSYKAPETTGAQLLPLLRLNPATTGDWDANVLNRMPLAFPGAEPEAQTGIAFKVDGQRRPELVALTRQWSTPPAEINGEVEFIVDDSIGEWSAQLGDSATNPELSWEYWNGTGWWGLDLTNDATGNLKQTGLITFDVPPDLSPTDWSGRTNHWIRARLIGGDYGREKVTIRSEPDGNATIQTVERSLEGIRPPLVLNLTISYGLCGSGVRPKIVQAEDSGTFRDQSDANRTAGAIVEAFVPLAVTLGRLSGSATPTAPAHDCPPECACGGKASLSAPVDDSTGSVISSSRRDTGRSLFVGLTGSLSESPVNILVLVEEKDHASFAPISIEALIADEFVPIVADDKTRALGESGLISMSFSVPPTPTELFGKTLTWLRLKPQGGGTDNWRPTLRGVYLNAVWASATETLTRELLGSSNGEPNHIVRLARPPVLNNTLELRVKEPLGEEERDALLKENPDSVLTEVQGLEGDWVLWRQVLDPGDESAGARVYSLDEETGEIVFGDGRHGKIPPIGSDAIVAFSYKRTEQAPDGGDSVPSNGIAPRTELNLVSPVESVEKVTAADESAGGAPAESDERVLRFGFAQLRHRNRAVTVDDIEDIALQSSPDIVQARAFVRRGYVRLVVVMRGKNPQPNAAQIRELRRLLIDAGPVALGASGTLRIERPSIRKLRVEMKLRIATLDNAGALTDFVKQRLLAFFDTAVGGVDAAGWPLGSNPDEGDIALALVDAPYLESIKDVKLREITTDGEAEAELASVQPHELVMLDDDPVRIVFETAEVMV